MPKDKNPRIGSTFESLYDELDETVEMKALAREKIAVDRLNALITKIEQIVPYVEATISEGNCRSIPGMDRLLGVDEGRIMSSRRQLSYLVHIAKTNKVK